ncbi:uracil-DNA glycosylase family protein [Maribacter sp. 2308TA10-17]|uniref:uracil-DNA glycosylase family protein n=1 Tax=Maribacter sp. 2308TA10-17 TaxID=3386276 RepID=UPI0039BD56D7
MFLHTHPYEPFLFPEATKLIVGTLPPPRFTKGELKDDDVDFCYGSRNGQLWPILDRIFNLDLKYETTEFAAKQRKDFLLKYKIGVCDIVASAERDKIDASDLGMQNIQLRNLVGYLQKYKAVHTILFTGGNSKNGPEYFFRKHLKEYQLKLKVVSDIVPRIHEFDLPVSLCEVQNTRKTKPRTIKTISLTAPSGAANRAVGSMDLYKKLKDENPDFTTFDFRVMQYRPFFER